MYEVMNSPWLLRSDPVAAWEHVNGNGASGFQSELSEKFSRVSLEELEELKRSYASLLIQLDRLRPKLAAADALSLSAEGGWSVKEILGHLIDTDRDVWWPRITAILERKNWCTLPMEDIFAQLMRTRWEFAMKLQEIAASDFEKKGDHPSLGEVSILRILQFLVANDARYLDNIRSLVDGKSEMFFSA
jgi:DinB superfamily